MRMSDRSWIYKFSIMSKRNGEGGEEGRNRNERSRNNIALDRSVHPRNVAYEIPRSVELRNESRRFIPLFYPPTLVVNREMKNLRNRYASRNLTVLSIKIFVFLYHEIVAAHTFLLFFTIFLLPFGEDCFNRLPLFPSPSRSINISIDIYLMKWAFSSIIQTFYFRLWICYRVW